MRADRMSRTGAGGCRARRKGKGKPMRNKGRDDIVWNWGRRGAAWLLSLALLCGAVPWQGVTALAAPAPETGMETTELELEPEPVDWAQEYLDKLVSWGVMRGDIEGNLHSDADITRAEFVTMVNRAYGYDQVGANPFTDVDLRSWYADDISIAYNVGYFTGTSNTTAAPETGLTRGFHLPQEDGQQRQHRPHIQIAGRPQPKAPDHILQRHIDLYRAQRPPAQHAGVHHHQQGHRLDIGQESQGGLGHKEHRPQQTQQDDLPGLQMPPLRPRHNPP